MTQTIHTIFSRAAFSAALALLLTSCAANKENVLAVTTTVIGVQVHQKDADKTPEMKVGYARTEFAFVPTDKSPKGGSSNSSEVLMEINASGSLALGSVYQGGIYQRLAVGRIAVTQPGASLMMSKDQNGSLSPDAVKKATAAIKAVQSVNPTNPEDSVVTPTNNISNQPPK